MIDLIVLAATSTTATFPRTASRGVRPPAFDRVSITKRLLLERAHRNPSARNDRPSVATQSFHYSSIAEIACSENCFITDLNNEDQVLLGIYTPRVVTANGRQIALRADLSSARNTYLYANANALNDSGGVAGYYRKGFYYNAPVGNLVWQLRNGAYPVSYWDGYDNGAEANALNDADISVGVSGTTDSRHVNQASVFSPNPKERRHALAGLDETCGFSPYSSATGINDAGTIVGYVQLCDGNFEAVRFSTYGYAKPVLDIQPPAAFDSFAEAINRNGDIAGFAEPPPSQSTPGESFLYRDACKCSAYLPRPTGETNGRFEALALNHNDQVVGDIVDPFDEFDTAFLYTNGTTYDLNAILPPGTGWTINTASAINDAGDIVGSGDLIDSSGNLHSNALFEMRP